MFEVLKLTTEKKTALIDITGEIIAAVSRARIESGLCYVHIPHSTAGITINENADPAVTLDIDSKLNRMIPRNEDYTHSEGNSDSHIKSSIFGSTLTIIIEKNGIMLGTWQSIYFCEFDGPRNRMIYVKTIKG